MTTTLVVMFIAGLITGFSKFSVGGMGLLVLPIVMIAFPGPEALGVLLPLYAITDIMAAYSYRKNISWAVLARFIPLGFLGVIVGAQLLSSIDEEQFVTLLGIIIVAMIALGFYLDTRPVSFMQKPWAAYSMGFLSGLISMISNAAGPLYSLFLLEQKLNKESYISTRAWGFFIINIIKFPLYISLGLLSQQSLTMSSYALPGLLVGSFFGYHFLKRVKQKHFKWLIRIMSTLAAIKLILFS
ncbi:sulfite exporter TauE/SafE family protein [Marinomonas piezotolerans]|uniref:Probable membrane transporter protein n=1 Tax=Marinomonas piezotolerans TaxID=2213058 RepID=A0A370UBT8_9GAMM|nr:sulfite exporter TauE/SafE family protein [Marinomonas piezotolerans]RDL45218.1 sulfite exporter TauE/SafE family protein [Marinomonas piezotolerans]